MTYLPGYGEFSKNIPNKHTVDCLDLLRESILYLEKEKYELWYCINNEEIGKQLMSINQDFMDHYGFSFKEYAIFKLGGMQTVLDPLVGFLSTFDYVSKEELTIFLQDTLAIEGGIKAAEILTVNKAIEIMSEDIANEIDDDDEDSTEKTIEDIITELDNPNTHAEQQEVDDFLKKLEKDPLPPIVYEAELPAAYVDTLLQAANGIYKVFTEMVYSQKRYKHTIPAYTGYMQKHIRSCHPSSTTAYLDRIISKNFMDYRKGELEYLDLQTDAHHNNYHNIKLDILYNIFRTKLSLETESLPLFELKDGGDINFTNYEKKLNDEDKKFRENHHTMQGKRIIEEFNIVPLNEREMQPIISYYADSADEKINNKNKN